ncbi:MAG: histidinol-phosphate transaminase [Candidatus Microthrix parvicella]
MADNPTGPRIRPEVHAGAPYRPGRAATGVDVVKLSSNELPTATTVAAVAAAAAAGEGANRYPDPTTGALRQALAAHHGLDAAQVSVGAGSVALISEAITATSSEGHSVVHGLPSFEAYPQLVRLAGARSAEVPNDASRLDPNGFVTVANVEDARLVLIANPNNPTGTAWRTDEVLSVLNGVASDRMVVLDEAYHEFVTDPDVPDGVALLADHPNLVVLRTFSKAWGLAGLRIGYAMGASEVMAALDAVRLPFSVSAPAQAAALAALGERTAMEAAVASVLAERARLLEGLNAAGWTMPDSQANFVWFGVGERAVELGDRLEAAGIIARVFPGVGVRLTVGTAADTDRILAGLSTPI